MKYVERLVALLIIAVLAVVASVAVTTKQTKIVTRTTTVTRTVKVKVPTGYTTLYITNRAQQYISDKQIENDIPAWEQAVNHDFSAYWTSPQFKLVFLGSKSAPSGAMSAVFVNKGPVKGALAYHATERGNAPDITIYAGTGDYFGYDNSISFTHELFELAADADTSLLSLGYPSDYFYLQMPNGSIKQGYNTALGWFNEVSDPVEADYYYINGVKISDFITPAWFNVGIGTRYDYLGLCQQPYWIRPGGYAQFLATNGWNVIFNFRHGHPADSGFYKGDPNMHGRVTKATMSASRPKAGAKKA